MSHDKPRIEAALTSLVGTPLWGTHRAADLQVLHFGPKLTGVVDLGPRKGEPTTYGTFSLHLQCAWRISGPCGIYVASMDLLTKGTVAKDVPDDEWHWTDGGVSRRDELLASWLADRTYAVEGHRVDAHGGFTLQLSDGYELQVFIDESGDGECWRMLFNDEDRHHFVVLGNGIED